jgi:hypothetical protein
LCLLWLGDYKFVGWDLERKMRVDAELMRLYFFFLAFFVSFFAALATLLTSKGQKASIYI